MKTAFVNGRILLPEGLRDDACVLVAGDRIEAITDRAPGGARIVDLDGDILLPGFIDVQVNGGGGRLFNEDPSVETVAIMAEAHRQFGTTGLLPTLISDDLSVVERGIAAVEEAIQSGVPGILGIHIEGPFLSRARRGIHLASMLQSFDDRFVKLVSSAKLGKTVVTVAPECVEPAQISDLVQAGVIVCAGHSDADYETVRAAIDAGATGFTHLFNGMSQLTNREPGVVGAALEDRSTYAGVIIDGQHIHPASFRVALNAKDPDRLMLVTDAMASAGSDRCEFTLQGRRISREGQRLVNDEGVLAGSTLTMAEAVANAMEQGRLSLASAVQMASRTPAQFLGLERETGTIAPGLRADLLVVREDFTIVSSWIGGQAKAADAIGVSAPAGSAAPER
jgi:N-acetylglucosamine-6-phosphate deacetylase